MGSSRRARRIVFFVAFCSVLHVAPAAPASEPPHRRPQHDGLISLGGGSARLLAAVRISAPIKGAQAYLSVIRALHGNLPTKGRPLQVADIESCLAEMTRGAEGHEDERIPSLLPQSVWEAAVFGRQAGNLAVSILRDSRASLLYYGLFSLDDETLEYFSAHPPLVSAIYEKHAAVFAAFAESITVHQGKMVLPGDASRAAEWEQSAGAPAADPVLFIPKLLGRDDGRLAWLLDIVSMLDAPHQAFALNEGVEAIYRPFGTFERSAYPFPLRPFKRGAVDPALVLRTVAVGAEGTMAMPRNRGLWQAVFAVCGGGDSRRDVTAPWLLECLNSMSVPARREHLDTILFAERRARAAAGWAGNGNAPDLVQTLAAFRTHSALMLTLEHLGFTAPRDYLRAVQAAERLNVKLDMTRTTLRTAIFQGALAVVTRLVDAGSIDAPAARRRVEALVVATSRAGGRGYSTVVADWLEELLRALPAPAEAAQAGADDRLLEGMAGAGVRRATPAIVWEDDRYRVDIAAGERWRLRRVRAHQGATSLSDVLAFRSLTSGAVDSDAAARLIDLVSRLDVLAEQSLFWVGPLPVSQAQILSGLRAIQRNASTDSKWQELLDAQDILLADCLASYAYAIAIKIPESPLLWAGDPARRHNLDVRPAGRSLSWTVGTTTRQGSVSILKGSLLGLDRALALSSLRQTSLNCPDVAPEIGQQDVQGFAESVTTMNPFRMTDEARDAAAAAITRGRERIAEAVTQGAGTLDALAARIGIERWRRRLMRLSLDDGAQAVMDWWCLGEVARAGNEETAQSGLVEWGPSQRLLDGSWDRALPGRLAVHELGGKIGTGLVSTQVADLSLRVGEWLAEHELPAVLAQGILLSATWDLVLDTRMADLDDWLAVSRSARVLPADRLADYVSALTARGPLVPLPQEPKKEQH